MKAYRLQMDGYLDEAIEHYTQSIELKPTAEAYTFRGWAKSIRRDYEDAIADCRTAIDLDPDFGNPYNDIGAYLIAQGEYEEAVPYLELATRARRYATPHFPYYNMGQAYERMGLWFEALNCYKQSLALSSDYEIARTAQDNIQGKLN